MSSTRRATGGTPPGGGGSVLPPPAQGDVRVKAALAFVIALVLIAGVWLAISLGRRGESPAGSAAPSPSGAATTPAPRPRGALGPGQGIVVAPPGGAPTTATGPRVDIYLDPQCPWCKRFHETLKSGFDDLRGRNAATIVIHPKSFLDARFGNDSSQRAAEAMACASDSGRLWEYTDAMFAAQPTAEGQGYTDAQLTQFATRAGIGGQGLRTWQSCTSSHRYSAYVDEVETVSVRDERVNGTPTYRVDGHDVDLSGVLPDDAPPNPQAFFDQVRAP